MPAAVVPLQMGAGHGKRQAILQEALHILGVLVPVLYPRFEEGGGRQLLRIPCYHGVLPPGKGVYRLVGGYLGRFVEYHDVEPESAGLQILGHRKRAHEHAGADPLQQVRYLSEKGAQGFPRPLCRQGPVEYVGLRPFRRCIQLRGHVLLQTELQDLPIDSSPFRVHSPEFGYEELEVVPVEGSQVVGIRYSPSRYGSVKGFREGILQLHTLPSLGRFCDREQPELPGLCACALPSGPIRQPAYGR